MATTGQSLPFGANGKFEMIREFERFRADRHVGCHSRDSRQRDTHAYINTV